MILLKQIIFTKIKANLQNGILPMNTQIKVGVKHQQKSTQIQDQSHKSPKYNSELTFFYQEKQQVKFEISNQNIKIGFANISIIDFQAKSKNVDLYLNKQKVGTLFFDCQLRTTPSCHDLQIRDTLLSFKESSTLGNTISKIAFECGDSLFQTQSIQQVKNIRRFFGIIKMTVHSDNKIIIYGKKENKIIFTTTIPVNQILSEKEGKVVQIIYHSQKYLGELQFYYWFSDFMKVQQERVLETDNKIEKQDKQLQNSIQILNSLCQQKLDEKIASQKPPLKRNQSKEKDLAKHNYQKLQQDAQQDPHPDILNSQGQIKQVNSITQISQRYITNNFNSKFQFQPPTHRRSQLNQIDKILFQPQFQYKNPTNQNKQKITARIVQSLQMIPDPVLRVPLQINKQHYKNQNTQQSNCNQISKIIRRGSRLYQQYFTKRASKQIAQKTLIEQLKQANKPKAFQDEDILISKKFKKQYEQYHKSKENKLAEKCLNLNKSTSRQLLKNNKSKPNTNRQQITERKPQKNNKKIDQYQKEKCLQFPYIQQTPRLRKTRIDSNKYTNAQPISESKVKQVQVGREQRYLHQKTQDQKHMQFTLNNKNKSKIRRLPKISYQNSKIGHNFNSIFKNKIQTLQKQVPKTFRTSMQNNQSPKPSKSKENCSNIYTFQQNYDSSCFKFDKYKGAGVGIGRRRFYPESVQRKMKENPAPGSYQINHGLSYSNNKKGYTFGASRQCYSKVYVRCDSKLMQLR